MAELSYRRSYDVLILRRFYWGYFQPVTWKKPLLTKRSYETIEVFDEVIKLLDANARVKSSSAHEFGYRVWVSKLSKARCGKQISMCTRNANRQIVTLKLLWRKLRASKLGHISLKSFYLDTNSNSFISRSVSQLAFWWSSSNVL